MELAAARQGSKKMAQSQVAGQNRLRVKASGLASRVFAGENSEVRVLGGFDSRLNVVLHTNVQGVNRKTAILKPASMKARVKLDGLKSAESPVATGVVEGASQAVMTWPPFDVTGVEVPPKKPGLAVIKRVDASEAEPGRHPDLHDPVPQHGQRADPGRLDHRQPAPPPRIRPQQPQGPAGTIFTFGENKAGALELRYDLPGAIAPGAEARSRSR